MAKKVRQGRLASAAPHESMKERLIAGLVAARKNILNKVAGLSPEQHNQFFLGEWSVKELLAHLIGWDYTYIAAIQDLIAGELPSFYEAYDADWRSYNSNLVREYEKENWSELVSALQQSHKQLVDYVQTLPDEAFGTDWGVRFRGTNVTIARLIEAETADEREHFRQISRWAG